MNELDQLKQDVEKELRAMKATGMRVPACVFTNLTTGVSDDVCRDAVDSAMRISDVADLLIELA